MVFKPFSHLARRSTKAFAHGYAQSLAAASQSSYASTQTPLGQINHHRFGKVVSLQQRENHHQAALQANSTLKPGIASPAEPSHDGSLDTYFNAWQKHQAGEEWQQFINSKRPSWKNRSGYSAKALEKDDKVAGALQDAKQPPRLERTRSASALDDIKKLEDGPSKGAELADQDVAQGEVTVVNGAASTLHVPSASLVEVEKTAPGQKATVPTTSVEDWEFIAGDRTANEANAYAEQIEILEKSKNYGEIPLVFEAMLHSGIRPSARSYGSLLLAAIRLSSSLAQVVPKAIDIYSSMLRQRQAPNGSTYAILLELLSLRALEVRKIGDELERNHLRYPPSGGRDGFMLRSRELELAIASEDNSFQLAVRLFESSTADSPDLAFPSPTYRFLLEACAKQGDVDQMIKIYSHMESKAVTPDSSSYPPMIQAFARSGDLRSAVECYNEYKTLATADDNGVSAIRSRADRAVYSALIRSYLICDRRSSAERFLQKITSSTAASQPSDSDGVQGSIILNGFIEELLVSGQFSEALAVSRDIPEATSAKQHALSSVAAVAADHGQKEVAEKAYSQLQTGKETAQSAVAMLAMYLRMKDLSMARPLWHFLFEEQLNGSEHIEPTIAYCMALIEARYIDEGLAQARGAFNRIRQSARSGSEGKDITELIDEGITYIAKSMAENHVVPSAEASMTFMWAMVENGGLLTPIAEQLLAGLRLEDITRLSRADLQLALQIEAGIIVKTDGEPDSTHIARFAHILGTTTSSDVPLDMRTTNLVKACLNKCGQRLPELIASKASTQSAHQRERYIPHRRETRIFPVNAQPMIEHADPYSNTLDLRGSTAILDELERTSSSPAACLHEALARLRNIRRAGRHPRYIVYSKLISAAAREGRVNLINELLGLAQRDVPLIDHSSVKQGWAAILDAMIGAFLTCGDRIQATKYHQQMLDVGLAPSANTFGLYITTLKESTKTFDEATEAVRIFLRAKAEGVEPSSFLYNALIGKLGKARRIDDCLFYFAEMRARGVRPTSVTYGTIVNALCRVSDERFAEELFDEMESMPNYKPRPAPYNSMMQFYLTTKRDSSKVLEYYRRMQSRNIQPTMHTYKLLIDTYATLEPINLAAAEGVFDAIRASGQSPEDVHYASLIHAKGCALHDMAGAREVFEQVVSQTRARPHACLYQALSEAMVANHSVHDTEALMVDMQDRGVEMTAYIANTLIHGWALVRDIHKASAVYNNVGKEKREPSTYEAMVRAFLAVEDHKSASGVAEEMLSRGYPAAVSGKVIELLSQQPTSDLQKPLAEF